MRWTILLGIALYTAIGVAADQGASSEQNRATAQPDYTQAIALLEKFIEHEMADKELQALSISLVDDQAIVWSQGFGLADPKQKLQATAQTIYRVGSVSKLFTDLAVMQLVEAGKLNLDAPVSHYLPSFHPHNPFGTAITLRQLMSHRAGLVREPPIGNYFDPSQPSLLRTVESLNNTSLMYRPGTRIKYSNAGIAVVGRVLEYTQRVPFEAYLQRTVLEPLGLKDSSFAGGPAAPLSLAKGVMWTVDGRIFEAPTFRLGMSPAGSLDSSSGDLARFLSVLFAGGQGPNGRILKSATLESMWNPAKTASGTKAAFGIGFRVSELDGRRRVGHDGAIYGFATHLSALPDDKLGVVVVTTKDCANAVVDRIGEIALRAMLATRRETALPVPEVTVAVDPEQARRIAGVYSDGDRGVELMERGGTLWMLGLDGGYLGRIRSLGENLVVDGLLAFGQKIVQAGDRLRVGTNTFTRRVANKPAPPPPAWQGIIGEYGWDHDVLYILERDGKLWALIEWFEFAPLKSISPDVFRFPAQGLYADEELVVKRDVRGRAAGVVLGSVFFAKRLVGPEEGASQLRVQPVKPLAELRREAMAVQPPNESGDFWKSDLVELTRLDSTIKLDVRYATTNNFLGTVFYSEARAFMQRTAAEALVRVHHKLKTQGYGLLVFDAYRPWFVTKVFWEATPEAKRMFVANPAEGSRHNRGAAVDLTLYDLKTGQPVSMVSTYDETTDRAYPYYPGATSLQRWYRRLLRQEMRAEGFSVYETEWWHFDYKDWRHYAIGNLPFERIGSSIGFLQKL